MARSRPIRASIGRTILDEVVISLLRTDLYVGSTMADTAPRAFEHILGELEASISAGALEAGDRLPPERDLAARYRVSRASVREAIRVLEAMGIVSVRRGADHRGV